MTLEKDPVPRREVWTARLRVWGVFAVLTAVMTWPNVWHLATRSVEHQDVYFNLWRLRWVHHALLTAPRDLFNGNQFHPEPGVLAYSDAMLVESLIALPLLSAGLAPVLVHNLLLLGAITASGIGMFVLARTLWGSTAGALIAGIVFAYAPYRFAHYMHMELQWTMWMPWAFWAMHRTFESARLRHGTLTGVFIALQFTSSIYYGLFLCVIMSVVGLVQFSGVPRKVAVLRAFAAGAVLAGAVVWLYSAPYREASTRVGLRSLEEISRYSATPSSYLRVPEANRLYGRWRPGSTEVSLYPGLLPVLLAVCGVALVRPNRVAVAYAAGLLLAFDLSLGLNGLIYPFLQQHVGAFKGLRAPSRASIFVLLALGVLAARAWTAFVTSRPARRAAAATTAAVVLILAEYWSVPLRLIAYPNRAPLYEYLATLPRGPVVEFPVPRLNSLPGHDGRYLYMSTFHWHPLVNGYSGYYPQTYIRRMARLGSFPSATAMAQLKFDKVRYVIVHDGWYHQESDGIHAIEAFVRLGARPLVRMNDGWWPATLLELPAAAPAHPATR